MGKPLISPDCVHAEDFRCKQCLDWQRERRDAWVRFAAGYVSFVDSCFCAEEAAQLADDLLAEFDARFGKKEEG